MVDTFLWITFATVLWTLMEVGAAAGLFSAAGGRMTVAGLVGLLPIVYPLVFEILWKGQTPGKRWVRLRVVGIGGAPASAAALTLRNALRLVDWLPLGYGAGTIAMFVSERDQRLGDLAAGTVVVREDQAAYQELTQEADELRPAPPELRGIAPSVIEAARRLFDPARLRSLDPAVASWCRQETLRRVRASRPDLADRGDDELWAWLGRTLQGES
jgi:uncharacterized RDD family membrane protein YckC